MTRRIILTVAGLVLLIGIIAGIKALQIRRMVEQQSQFVPPAETVTTAEAKAETWESLLTSVGSLTAVHGVRVAAEMSGRVTAITFEAGADVQAGDLLLRQDTSTEEALLPGAEAKVVLTKTQLDRISELLARKLVSQSEYDSAIADYRQAVAEADNIRAIIGKKTIRAPFAGRLGIRLVNLGQILNEGDAIVSLQSLRPIFVDFLLPQQQLNKIAPGLSVRVTTDALAGEVIVGRITAINPELDAATRNVRIQATIANTDERLRPGMFVDVAVVLPAGKQVCAIPATAVLYAPYGDSVFIVEEKESPGGGPTVKVLRQQFVRLGERRGDFVAVISGVKEGETVVSTGVFKLRNGQAVLVDNSLSPEFQLAPRPEEG